MEDNETLDVAEPDIQDLVSRWAGESKRLLVALPGVLAKLEDLAAEAERLRQRLADMERENVTLRQSREELAETFAKLKTLIGGTSLGEALTDLDPQRPRPTPPQPASPEPTEVEAAANGQPASPAPANPEPPVVEPASPEPSPRFAGRQDKPPATKEEAAPAPPKVRFSSVFRPPTRS
jgi:hypothetical protein